MVYWIRRLAHILAVTAFFVVFFAGIDPVEPFHAVRASMAFVRAALAASLFWFGGFVIGDIVVKGVVEDIPEEAIDELEGGMLQRVREAKAAREAAMVNSDEEKPVAGKQKAKKHRAGAGTG
jgi:cytochrome b subunit of formate dehydrogenase